MSEEVTTNDDGVNADREGGRGADNQSFNADDAVMMVKVMMEVMVMIYLTSPP